MVFDTLLALAAGLTPVTESVLDPMGPVAAEQKAHLIRIVAVTMIAITPVLVGVPILLWRYRYRQGGAPYRPNWAFNGWLEVVLWGVPIAITISLGILLARATIKLDPVRPLGPEPLQVQVVGLNWKWLFIYPEQGTASVDTLVIPVGRPVTLTMTSDTVMQSMMAPALFGQIYSMPGMETKMNFSADRTGTTKGRNWQYSGDGFSTQQFVVNSVSKDDFDRWIASGQQSPVTLNAASYDQLAKPKGEPVAVNGPMKLGEPDLFRRVIMRYHHHHPVPDAKQPGTPTYVPQVSQ